MTAWWWCRARTPPGWPRRRRSARTWKAKSAPGWRRGCWGWTCTACASRWPGPDSNTSTEPPLAVQQVAVEIPGQEQLAAVDLLRFVLDVGHRQRPLALLVARAEMGQHQAGHAGLGGGQRGHARRAVLRS